MRGNRLLVRPTAANGESDGDERASEQARPSKATSGWQPRSRHAQGRADPRYNVAEADDDGAKPDSPP